MQSEQEDQCASVYPNSPLVCRHPLTEQRQRRFFDTLQATIDTVPEEDVMVILGDWNSRVGSSERTQNGMVYEVTVE